MDADLVLEGGGVKGIGLVGALKVFGDAGYRFRRVAGTSAGAIVGSLAAAGVPPDQLQRIMQELDYRKFQDGDFLSHLGAPNAALMAPAPSIRGVVRFGLALVATMTNAHDQMHLDEPSVVDRTVFVDTFGVKATDFDLDAKTRDQLFDKGTAAGKKFLDGWNFDRYLDTYWRPTSAAAAST